MWQGQDWERGEAGDKADDHLEDEEEGDANHEDGNGDHEDEEDDNVNHEDEEDDNVNHEGRIVGSILMIVGWEILKRLERLVERVFFAEINSAGL